MIPPNRHWPTVIRQGTFWIWYYGNSAWGDYDDGEEVEASAAVLEEIFGPDELDALLGPGVHDSTQLDTPGSRLDLTFPGDFTWRLKIDACPSAQPLPAAF